MNLTKAEAQRIVKQHGLRGLSCTTIDRTYYFEGPQEAHSEDIFGSKPNKRPWVLVHFWEGYGPEKFVLSDKFTALAEGEGR